jgi:hypothetical protein
MEMASSVIYDIISGGGPSLQADTVAEVAKDSFVTSKLLDKIKELEAALATKDTSSIPTGASTGGVSIGNSAPVVAAPVVIPGIMVQTPEPVAMPPVIVAAPVPAPSVEPVAIPAVVVAVPEPVPAVVAPEPVTLNSILNSAPAIPAPAPIPVVIPGVAGLVIPPLP